MDEKYSLFTHRHNFAIWAAARASQRGLKGASVSTLKAALEASGLPDAIQDASKWPRSADHFDSFHRRHCNRIADHLGNAGVANVSYGRVAKLVAIYLKSMVVVSEHAGSTFAAIIHPPIDRSLLQNMAKDRRFGQHLRSYYCSLGWTGLSDSDYFALIEEFRRSELDQPAFWMIEKYWQPTDDADA